MARVLLTLTLAFTLALTLVNGHSLMPRKETIKWNFTAHNEGPVRQPVYHKQYVDLVIGNPGHVTRLRLDFDCSDSVILFVLPEDSSKTWSSNPDTVIVYIGNTIVRLSFRVDPTLHDVRSWDPYEGYLCFGRHSDIWKYWSKVTFSPYMLVLGAYHSSLVRLNYEYFELVFRKDVPLSALVRGHRYPLQFDLGNEYTYVPRQLYHAIADMDIIINNLHMDVDQDDLTTRLINGFDRSLFKKNVDHSDTTITLGRYFGHNFVVFYDGVTHTQRVMPSFHFFNTGHTEPFYSNFGLGLFTSIYLVFLSFVLVQKNVVAGVAGGTPATRSTNLTTTTTPATATPSTRATSSVPPSPYTFQSTGPASPVTTTASTTQTQMQPNGDGRQRMRPLMIGSTVNTHIVTPKSSHVLAVAGNATYVRSTPQTPSVVSPEVVMFLEFYGYLAAVLIVFIDIHGMVGSRNFSSLLATTTNLYYIVFHAFLEFNIVVGAIMATRWPGTLHHMGIRRIFFETTAVMCIFLFSTYQHDSYSMLFIMLFLFAIYTNFRIMQCIVCFLQRRYRVLAISLVYSALAVAFFYFYTIVPITNYFFAEFDDVKARIMLIVVGLIGVPTLAMLILVDKAFVNSAEDVVKDAIAARSSSSSKGRDTSSSSRRWNQYLPFSSSFERDASSSKEGSPSKGGGSTSRKEKRTDSDDDLFTPR